MTKKIVGFPTGPHIDPKVDPKALKYSQGIQARKYQEPVAGGPMPTIPVLNQPHRDGMTMADQAGAATPATAPVFSEPSLHRTQKQATGILPTDILPEAAKHDPAFQGGMGSMHASSQPHLAYKYGVIRNGQPIPPQQLQTGRPGLSKNTIEGLKALNNMQAEVPVVEDNRSRQEAERNVSASASAAARLPNGPGDNDSKPLSEADREKLGKAIEKMDDFDFNTFREMMMKDILNNEDQRKAIESRLEPLDLTDLILTGRVTQRVPIIPGKYEPEFQSVSGEEDLAIKRLIWQEQKSLQAPSQYMLDKFSLMGVALGTRAINGTLLPSHLNSDGSFDENNFLKKFNTIVRYPFHLLSSLGINFFWFDVRVRQLFQADLIKNG